MSYQDFENALELASRCKNYTVRGTVSDEVISNAEILFGYKFSEQTYNFLKKVGYLSFTGHEFFGICNDDFTGDHHGNMIESTLADRKDYQLPREWLTIYFFDDGYYGYLDYSKLNKSGEPSVIMAIYNGREYEMVEKVANDFGEFILKCVENKRERN